MRGEMYIYIISCKIFLSLKRKQLGMYGDILVWRWGWEDWCGHHQLFTMANFTYWLDNLPAQDISNLTNENLIDNNPLPSISKIYREFPRPPPLQRLTMKIHRKIHRNTLEGQFVDCGKELWACLMLRFVQISSIKLWSNLYSGFIQTRKPP